MTESDWRACQEPQKMLASLRDSGKLSERKVRLFAVACCRLFWRLSPPEHSGAAALVSERYADGLATKGELKAARKRARSCEAAAARLDAYQAATGAASAAASAVWWLTNGYQGPDPIVAAYTAHTRAGNRLVDEQSREQAALLRDIFGPLPFRPVTLPPSVRTWNDGCVVQLATSIYEDRDFSSERMGVLGDALEEAGVSEAEVLAHLRSPGPHCRGCWAVDLVLGKG